MIEQTNYGAIDTRDNLPSVGVERGGDRIIPVIDGDKAPLPDVEHALSAQITTSPGHAPQPRITRVRVAGHGWGVVTVVGGGGAFRKHPCTLCPRRRDAPVGAFPRRGVPAVGAHHL